MGFPLVKGFNFCNAVERKWIEEHRLKCSSKFGSVQERHVGHRAALGFRIHQNPVPERQCDGRVIAVTHVAAGIDAGIAGHDPPAPRRRAPLLTQDRAVLVRCHPVGIVEFPAAKISWPAAP